MPTVTDHLVRALISGHGDKAVAVAERGRLNCLELQMIDKAREWERVVAAIKAIQTVK